MRLNRLTLKNFRSYDHCELELSKVNIFRAPNNFGKSSIAIAIQWLLAGIFPPLTDESGKGADSLITIGAKDMSVAADIFWPEIGENDAGRLSRSRNRGGDGWLHLQSPDFGTPDLLGKDAYEWINVQIGNKDLLVAVLNSSRFINLSPKEQKMLLSAALSGNKVTIPEAIKQAMDTCENGVTASVIDSVESAKKIYDIFFELRREKKAELKGLGDIEEPKRPKDMPELAAFQKIVAGVRDELSTLTSEKAKRISDFTNAKTKSSSEARAVLLRDKAEIEMRIAQKRSHLEVIDKFTPKIIADDKLEKLRETAKSIRRFEELKKIIEAGEAEIKVRENDLAKLRSDTAPAVCPTCGQSIKKKDMTAHIKESETEIERLGKVVTVTKHNLSQLGDPASAQTILDAHKEAFLAVKNANDALNKIIGQDSLEDINKRIAAFEAKKEESTGGLFDSTPDVSDIEAKEKSVNIRITKGEAGLAEILQFEGQRQAHEKLKTKKVALETKITAAHIVVEHFAEAGPVRTALVGDKLTEFKSKLAASLKHFGFECVFEIEPFSFQVRPAGNTERMLDLKQLSESQALRFSVCFQCALALATDIKLVIIDGVDKLLPAVRKQLTAAILSSGLDQAIILLAADPASVNVDELPEGVKIFDLGMDELDHTFVVATYGGEERAELSTD